MIKNLKKVSDLIYSIQEWIEYPESNLTELEDNIGYEITQNEIFFIDSDNENMIIVMTTDDNVDILEGITFADNLREFITDNYSFKILWKDINGRLIIDDLFNIPNKENLKLNEKVWKIYTKRV